MDVFTGLFKNVNRNNFSFLYKIDVKLPKFTIKSVYMYTCVVRYNQQYNW